VFFAPQDYAVYSRGAMRIPFISSIPFTLNDIMMPKYVKAYQKGDIPDFLHNFHLCIEKVAKLNFPIFGLMFAIAPSIITFLYTEEYRGAASIFRVYLFALLTGITVYGVIPRASGKTSCLMVATALSIGINIPLSVVFVSQIGAIGAALATLVAGVIVTYYYLSQSCKILQISCGEIFPWKFLAQVLLISLIASVPVYVLEIVYQPTGLYRLILLIVEGLIYVYIYLFLMMRKSLIFEDEFELLQKWLRFDVNQFFRKIVFLP
jgi:O-antigen/teichoic acid export membrane protein